jgi:putative ABC transport system ATP-binding protein
MTHDLEPGPGAQQRATVPAAPSTPFFSMQKVTKSYVMGEVEVHALRGVDFELREGEFLVLLGPSGSGKSTLLNILGGLDVPTSGRVFFREEELTGAGRDRLTEFRRAHVGFVFQFYNLIPSLTARENVALVTDIAASPMDAADALALVGLGERLNHFPSQMSGGEQQRVAIARAVAKQPAVLLCDEPTGALDAETGTMVLAALDSVHRQLGTATAVITHNVSIARMAHRIVSLADGHVAAIEDNPTRAAPAEIRW